MDEKSTKLKPKSASLLFRVDILLYALSKKINNSYASSYKR